MSVIQLQKLKFSNMFSYGKNNEIDLNTNRMTQLTAYNGVGKSSIALIIQELLYSKNIKNIKKGDILNRYDKEKTWSGSIDFSVDVKQYNVSVTRTGASTKVILLEDGVDISEHKILDTYKKIQGILNLEFDIFSQITYQSSIDLLDFLKATDTNRKKFLINLFNLEKYIAIGEKVKVRANEVDKELAKLQVEGKTISSFLDSTSIPDYMDFLEEQELDNAIVIEIADIEHSLNTIADTCKKIDKNNMLIKERESLSFDMSMVEPETFVYIEEYQTLKADLISLNNDTARLRKELNSVKINDKCPSCGQDIDNSHLVKMQSDLKSKIANNTEIYETNLVKAKQWSLQLEEYQNSKRAYVNNQSDIRRFEQLTQMIDTQIPSDYPNHQALATRKQELQHILLEQKAKIKEITSHNKSVSANNAKVDALKEQQSEFLIRQDGVKKGILVKSGQSASLSILKKAFSTTGIVAFKLENLTKELEATINYYLSVLSDGQFHIEFSLNKEKLNIDVVSNGVAAPIETTSGGEFSRIQTSILLAIRKLLSTLGGSSINLLFLDEITGVLDDEGKEKLVEVLQKENDLNVFLISHDFTHPLIEKVDIIKENNISTIQK